MDLMTRKYNLIEQLFAIKKESVLEALEITLKKEREAIEEISDMNKKILDNRLDSYNNSPNDLLNWNDVKENW